MSAVAAIERELAAVVDGVLRGADEEPLMAAADLGRRLLRDEVLPEEAVSVWSAALADAVARGPGRIAGADILRCTAPLVEMMMAYSMAFRQQIEQRREEEQRPLRAMAEQSTDGLLVCDRAGAVGWCNASMVALAGTDPGDLRAVLEALGSASAADDAAQALRCALGEGSVWQALLKRGDRRFDARVGGIRDHHGVAVGAALFLRETTAMHRLQELLRQRDRLEAVGTMAAGLAHDFNNLVGALLGYADLGLALAGDAPAVRDTFRQVHAIGLDARALVRQITDFAAGQERAAVATELGAVLAEAAAFFERYRPPGVALVVDRPEGPSWAVADRVGLQQVLLNLLNNACHAMKDGRGRIELRLQPGPSSDDRPGWRLTVVDDGCGMSAEVAARVFDPFFTTREVGQGSGLGLSMAYGVVTGFGGEIRVDSAPGRGACFELWLPPSPGASEALSRSRPA